MPFLYGNHVVKAHLGRITEDTPEHQGVVVFSMSDVPLVCGFRTIAHLPLTSDLQGFGVTARSTVDTRKLDPTSIIVFHQAYVQPVSCFSTSNYHLFDSDVGEYLRDEVTFFHKPLYHDLAD
jgi:60S ribosome subunit biogenesis protein NIP7